MTVILSEIDSDFESNILGGESGYAPSSTSESSDSSPKPIKLEGMKYITFFSSFFLLQKHYLICCFPAAIQEVYTRGLVCKTVM